MPFPTLRHFCIISCIYYLYETCTGSPCLNSTAATSFCSAPLLPLTPARGAHSSLSAPCLDLILLISHTHWVYKAGRFGLISRLVPASALSTAPRLLSWSLLPGSLTKMRRALYYLEVACPDEKTCLLLLQLSSCQHFASIYLCLLLILIVLGPLLMRYPYKYNLNKPGGYTYPAKSSCGRDHSERFPLTGI